MLNADHPLPTIDCHIHLAVSGCCVPGGYLSKKLRSRYTIRLMKWLHGVSDREMDTTFDLDWPARISRLIAESKELDYGVVLGFDGCFDHQSGYEQRQDTQMHVPVEWVFTVCRDYPNLLPGPSINPHRSDAMQRLEFCIEAGAVLIKWLPSAQNIDPALASLEPFYRLLADSGVPLLVHIGGEKTFYSLAPEYNRIDRLLHALDLGVKVICAHTGTPVQMSGEVSQIPRLIELAGKYPNLRFDNSGICNPSRFSHLPKIAKMPELVDRTLYGSDFPVPSNAFYYLRQMGFKAVRALEQEKNPFDRDIRIKRALGIPDETLTAAHRFLANLPRWIKPSR